MFLPLATQSTSMSLSLWETDFSASPESSILSAV